MSPEVRRTDRGLPRPRANPAWTRRKAAAARYRPKRIRLLLVDESPPADLDRYVYFDDPASVEPMFENLAEVVLDGEKPDPLDKPAYLKELKRRGLFVVELKPDAPRQDESLGPYVDWFVLSLADLAPEQVILIGADVDSVARSRLVKEGVAVVRARIPDPSRSPLEFRRALRTAMVRAGIEKLIRPRPARARAGKEAAEPSPRDPSGTPPSAPERKPRRRG